MRYIIILVCVILLTACGGAETPTKPGEEAYYAAQMIVEKNLKAPSTAKFSNVINDSDTGYKVLRTDLYEAWGWADSQNSFGAMLRSDWRMVLRLDSGKYQGLYMKIGTQIVGNYQTAIK